MCCAVSSYLSQRTADGGTDSRKVNSRPVPGLEKSQIRFVLSLIDYASYTEPTLECSTYIHMQRFLNTSFLYYEQGSSCY